MTYSIIQYNIMIPSVVSSATWAQTRFPLRDWPSSEYQKKLNLKQTVRYHSYHLPQGNVATARRQEAKPSFPLPLASPCRLEGTTLSDRLATSRKYK